MVADGSGPGGRAQRFFGLLISLLFITWIAVSTGAQQSAVDVYEPDAVELNPPAFPYNLDGRTDLVTDLNRRLMAGSATLKFEGPSGYLRSLLDRLNVAVIVGFDEGGQLAACRGIRKSEGILHRIRWLEGKRIKIMQ